MKLAGAKKDISGEDGISMSEIDTFISEIEKTRAWHKIEADVQTFGAETAAISAEAADLSAALDDYLKNEPYVIEGVWQKVEVETMNVVLVNGEKR